MQFHSSAVCVVLDGLTFERLVNEQTDTAREIVVDDPLNHSKSKHLQPNEADLVFRALAPSSIAARLTDVNNHYSTLYNVRLFDFGPSKGIGVIARETIPQYAVIMELRGPIITDKLAYQETDERIRATGSDSHFFFWKGHTVSRSNPWYAQRTLVTHSMKNVTTSSPSFNLIPNINAVERYLSDFVASTLTALTYSSTELEAS
jgi:hypothetical protein